MDYGLSVCRNHDWHAGSNARASRLIAWGRGHCHALQQICVFD